MIYIICLFFFPLPQDFLTKLVCNLLEEGNAFFKDRDWEQAVREFSEGLNVTLYAEGENLCVPEVLLESLFVNRATAYHSMVSKTDIMVKHFVSISFLPVSLYNKTLV